MDGLIICDLFALGVNGYLYRCDPLSECLLPAVDTLLRDRPYLSPTANAAYLLMMHSDERPWMLDAESRGVLRLLSQGHTCKTIALHANHLSRMQSLLNKRCRATAGEKGRRG